MKRLGSIGPWRRIGVQLGLLAGISLAFVGGIEPSRLAAAPKICQLDGVRTVKKPLFGIVLDYSTSMNEAFDKQDGNPATNTRWASARQAIKTAIDSDNGYLAANMILGLIRFGHDPDPVNVGTSIPKDSSGIIDGQKLDVGWYDPAAPDKKYYECSNGDAINLALDLMPAPNNGAFTGIGSWTRGALEFARAYIAQSKVDHPGDMDQRLAVLMLITDGEWTNIIGTQKLVPPEQDPALTAFDLFNDDGVPTYVVAIGEAEGKAFADKLAMAGGTNLAIGATGHAEFELALKQVIAGVKDDVVMPVCAPGRPRIMVLLDASSSMLNVNNKHASQGVGGWEEARQALAGSMGSIFDVLIDNRPVEDTVHFGLAVFGYNAPAEQKLVVQYGPCRKDNFAWALDPKSSCVAPGCVDPYGAPPILWTFIDGAKIDPPGFDDKTVSHMPKCDAAPNLPGACVGSGTYVHLGLELVQTNIAEYHAACKVDGYGDPCSDATEYINILITDGDYNSTNAQVKAPLEAMFAAGVTTFVVGFGDLVMVPASVLKLDSMAMWGSGGVNKAFKAAEQADLEIVLKTIVEKSSLDPCCHSLDCTFIPGPDPGDPDPPAPDTTTTGDGTTTDEASTTEATTIAADTIEPGTSTGAGASTGPGTSTGVGASTDPTTSAPTGGSEDTGVVTTAVTTTTTQPETTGEPVGPTEVGCACNGGSGHGGWLLALVPVLGRRRRRH